MIRLLDTFASLAYFTVLLPVATVRLAFVLVRDLAASLRNIWSKP